MRNSILVGTIIITLLTSCYRGSLSKKTENMKRPNVLLVDTISYSFHGANYLKNLNLLSDNRFILIEKINSSFGNETIKKHFGSYQKTDSTLVLTPKNLSVSTQSANPKTSYHKTSVAYGENSTKINTVYKIIRWNNKEYLLSEQFYSMRNYDQKNDYQRFAHYYNIGIEPHESGYYFTRKINNDNTTNKALNINHIPKKWQSYFLGKPITAKIIYSEKKVHKSKYDHRELISWRIKIDKGAKHGIKKGLSFSTEYEDFFIEIDSILPDVSFGEYRINDIDDDFVKIGTEMRTQW